MEGVSTPLRARLRVAAATLVSPCERGTFGLALAGAGGCLRVVIFDRGVYTPHARIFSMEAELT